MESVQFECKCGYNGGWIAEDQIISPCRYCGRQYKGIYDKKELTIKAVELEKSISEQ